MKIKERFPLYCRKSCSQLLSVSDPVAIKGFTKYHSSKANVFLHFSCAWSSAGFFGRWI